VVVALVMLEHMPILVKVVLVRLVWLVSIPEKVLHRALNVVRDIINHYQENQVV
jgi:hypothetical protein